MNRHRLLDWRFFVSLIALLLIAYIVWGGFVSVRENQRKNHRIDELISLVKERAAETDRTREQSATERDRLLRQQARLERQIAELQLQVAQDD